MVFSYYSCVLNGFGVNFLEPNLYLYYSNRFLGPRGPLGTPSSVRPSMGKKNLDQLYSSINHARLVVSGGVSSMSGGV